MKANIAIEKSKEKVQRQSAAHFAFCVCVANDFFRLVPFARGLGADLLIGTRLRYSEDGRIQGGLDGNNCRAKEKVVRLREVFGPDVHLTAAYGDTSGDTEMLAIADEKGYRVFRGRPA